MTYFICSLAENFCKRTANVQVLIRRGSMTLARDIKMSRFRVFSYLLDNINLFYTDLDKYL